MASLHGIVLGDVFPDRMGDVPSPIRKGTRPWGNVGATTITR